jgi:hypothetical protein
MKPITQEDQRRLEVIILFKVIPFIPDSLGEDKENIIFNFWGALYWGKKKKAFEEKWAEDGEDVIPNEINCFEYRKNLSETGTGANPNEAYENAILRMNMRRVKRGAEIMLVRSGIVVRNGANFYYTLYSEVIKIKQNQLV